MNSLCTSVGKFKALSKVKSDTDLKWPVCGPGTKAQECEAKTTNGRKRTELKNIYEQTKEILKKIICHPIL